MQVSVWELRLFGLFIVAIDGFDLIDYDMVTVVMMVSFMKHFVVFKVNEILKGSMFVKTLTEKYQLNQILLNFIMLAAHLVL